MFYQGMRLGILETVGLGWNRLDDYVQRVQAVTPGTGARGGPQVPDR
jgi:zinc protease